MTMGIQMSVMSGWKKLNHRGSTNNEDCVDDDENDEDDVDETSVSDLCCCWNCTIQPIQTAPTLVASIPGQHPQNTFSTMCDCIPFMKSSSSSSDGVVPPPSSSPSVSTPQLLLMVVMMSV